MFLEDLSGSELFEALDGIEQAIVRCAAFEQYTDGTGDIRIRVTAELLALVDDEQRVVDELRGRSVDLFVG